MREPDRAQAEQARRRHRDRQLRDRDGRRSSTTPTAVAPEQLVAAVEAAGYQRGAADRRASARPSSRATDPTAPLRRRLIISALLSLPVLLIAMIPALQFDNWQWLSLQLATPVVLWGAWPFHRAAWANLKHGTATMDTLISVGTLSAWLWSLYALFLGDAGDAGMRMAFDLIPPRAAAPNEIYLETAVDRDHVHPRRPLLRGARQAPRRRGAQGAARARRQGRRDPRGRRQPSAASRSTSCSVGDRFVVRPGEKVATDGVVEDGHSAVDMSMLTGESVPVEVGPGSEVAGRDDQRRRTPDRPRHQGRQPTPRSRRSRASSPKRRPARRRCSGSPTGSPASSSRS